MPPTLVAPAGVLDNLAHDNQVDRSRLILAIGSLIKTTPAPLVVAIYGQSGSGRSALLRQLQAYLEPLPAAFVPPLDQKAEAVSSTAASPAAPPVEFVTVPFNLWEHRHDVNPIVALLETARDRVEAQLRAQGWLGHAGLKAWKNRLNKLLKAVLLAMADEPLSSGDSVAGLNVSLDRSTASSFANQVDQVIEARFAVQSQQTKLHRIFDSIIHELVTAQLLTPADQTSEAQGNWPWQRDAAAEVESQAELLVNDPWEPTARLSTLVFLIDDLDRCDESFVANFLERVRTSLNQPQCAFVVTVGETVARTQAGASENGDLPAGLAALEQLTPYSFYLPLMSVQEYTQLVDEAVARVNLRPIVRAAVASGQPTQFMDALATGLIGDELTAATGPAEVSHQTGAGLYRESGANPISPLSPNPLSGAEPISHGLVVDVLFEQNATVGQVFRLINTVAVNDFLMADEFELAVDESSYDPRVMIVISLIQVLYPEEWRQLRRAGSHQRRLLHSLFYQDEPTDFLKAAVWLRYHASQIARDEAMTEVALARYLERTGVSATALSGTSPASPATPAAPSFWAPADTGFQHEWFVSTGGVFDAASMDQVCRAIAAGDQAPGSVVQLGPYRWIVLSHDSRQTSAILITESVIGFSQYHWELANVNWPASSLCRLLNSAEFADLLGPELWSRLLPLRQNDDGPFVILNSAADDMLDGQRVSLLSMGEYLNQRAVLPDAGRGWVAQGAAEWFLRGRAARNLGSLAAQRPRLAPPRAQQTWAGDQPASWWLRPPSWQLCQVPVVGLDGSPSLNDTVITSSLVGIRPAIRLNLRPLG
ncbi:MAG: hypothetical protein LBL92_03990 [Propionibacteriaceae bacterium]|jgi:hypothetical protein|nr:hypothetical protein [Propionibacteriaceae bacterium]